MTPKEWQTAGLTDAENGTLDRSSEPAVLVVPGQVTLRRGDLVWAHSAPTAEALGALARQSTRNWLLAEVEFPRQKTVSLSDLELVKGLREEFEQRTGATAWSAEASAIAAPPNLLEKFVGLCEAADSDIAAFAGSWGVLGICRHGLPCTHNDADFGGRFLAAHRCRPLGWKNDRNRIAVGREPLSAWRKLSKDARSILNIAAAIYNRSTPSDDDLQAIATVGMEWIRRNPHVWVARAVNRWLELGRVQPELWWPTADEAPFLTLGGRSADLVDWGNLASSQGRTLMGALALQLLYSVSRSNGLFVCGSCGKGYSQKRHHKAGKPHYCPACRQRAWWRDGKRRERLN